MVVLVHSSNPSLSSLDSSAHLTGEKPKWMHDPMPLKKKRFSFAIRALIDFLLVATSVPFIVLAVYVAWRSEAVVVEGEWSKLQTSTKVAVTAFPIVFAAVMSRLTKNIATWKLERGISLGHLEQLLGSSSVFGAFSTQLLMGSFNVLAICLFLLWALSPLGGQASLHIVSTVPSLSTIPNDISSLNTELPAPFDAVRRPLDWLGPQLNGIYVTSLMNPSSVKHSPVDTWGNIKVPLMSHLGLANKTGWHNIDPSKDDVPYSSLVGVPVSNLSPKGNTTFTLETSYFDLDCYSLGLSQYIETTQLMAVGTPPEDSDNGGNAGPNAGPNAGSGNANAGPNAVSKMELPLVERKDDALKLVKMPNDTFYGVNDTESTFDLGIDSYIDWDSGSLSTLSDSGLLTRVKNVTNNDETFFPNSQTFLFESKSARSEESGVHDPAAVAHCHIKRVYVESAVTCINDASRKPQCAVTAIRDSKRPHMPSDITPFMFSNFINQFVDYLKAENEKDLQSGSEYSLTERYLNNTNSPLLVQDTGMALYKMDKKVFSQRLTQVINTYYLGSLFPSAIVGGLDSDLPVYTVHMYTQDPISRTTTGQYTFVEYWLYYTNNAWLSVFFVAAVTMFLAASLSFTLASFTTIPDVLGYASSLTRDSERFPDSGYWSTLDGLSRSKKLKDRKVRLGDVRSGEDVGLLAFSEVELASRPQKGKLFQ